MAVKKIGTARADMSDEENIQWTVVHVGDFGLSDENDWGDHPLMQALGPEPEKDYSNYKQKKDWFSPGVRIVCKDKGKEAEWEREVERYRQKFAVVKEQIRKEYEAKSQSQPVPLDENKHYLYQGTVYRFNRAYSNEEMIFQIMELEDKERQKFEHLKRKFSSEEQGKEPGFIRERIPEEVRIAVWRRDDGKCVRCGSREKLEYDHILPISKGGSNTVRNIELLCEKCNRGKGAEIR